MKRFWLLLLAFVLPAQMSLAAVHRCDKSMPMAAMSHVFEHSDGSDVHQEVHHQHSADHDAEQLGDAGHGSAHGLNVFHGLTSQDGNIVDVVAAANFISTSHLLPVPGAFSTRHERPQWLPA